MVNLYQLVNRRERQELLPETVEVLAAEGLSRREMAMRVKMKYQTFCKRVNESLSLSEAFERGQQTAKEKGLIK